MNKPRKISSHQTSDFTKEGFSGRVYVTPESKEGFNALVVDVHGKHPRKRMVDTTRVYFVIEGTGHFTLGNETTQVNEGDLFVIPPLGEYEYEGQMRLFEFNVSPDNSFRDEVL
jgi:mannose-6-phosphate isomerase-like protein (cupin superfamily)